MNLYRISLTLFLIIIPLLHYAQEQATSSVEKEYTFDGGESSSQTSEFRVMIQEGTVSLSFYMRQEARLRRRMTGMGETFEATKDEAGKISTEAFGKMRDNLMQVLRQKKDAD